MKEKAPYTSRELVCPVCNKLFILSAYHTYKIEDIFFCGYNCRCKYEKEHPKKHYDYVRKWGK